MSGPEGRPRAVVFGCAGPELSAAERRFFAAANPLGFILFERNCKDRRQVRALVEALRGTVARADAPVLIDQEGGRVARLKPPQWRGYPAASRLGELARANLEDGLAAAHAAARLIAADLAELGITVDCAPVIDVPSAGAHEVIGDRAFATEPALVTELGRAFCRGLLDGGVLPVVKHIPGHGRARVDSHAGLPVVEVHRRTLEAIDFAPFRALREMPMAMTAHVVYRVIDPRAPATISSRVIGEVIRAQIGFDGLLVSDDIAMGALRGALGERTRAALAAGCDVVLHCSGRLGEMEEVAEAATPLSDAAIARLARAEARCRAPEAPDVAALEARLQALLGERTAGRA